MTSKEPIAPSEEKIKAMAVCDTSAALTADAPEITMSDVGKLARAYLYQIRQNAAESLPAAPEQPKSYGFIGKPLDSECFYGYHNQCRGCNCKCHPDAAKYEPVAPVEAKQKECPRCGSTSKHVTKAGWRCLDRWHYETEQVAEPKPTPSEQVFVSQLEPNYAHFRKSQPDSSSISTEPEQSVSFEELAELYNSSPVGSKQSAAFIELQRWRMKGQSNGR